MTMKALLAIGLAACSPTSDSKPRRPDPPHEAGSSEARTASPEAGVASSDAGVARDAGSSADARTAPTTIDAGTGGTTVITPKTCAEAKHAIETRHFVGWHGLPAHCKPDAMFGRPFDKKEWPDRILGKESAYSTGLDFPGYYLPTVSVRNGEVIMFDGMNPELDGGWAPLAANLGEPEAKLDWHLDELVMKHGEWIYPARGITIFTNEEGDVAMHISVYAPTTLAKYKASLRLDLGTTTLRPRGE